MSDWKSLENAALEYLTEFWEQPLFAMPSEQRERERDRVTVTEAFKAGAEWREAEYDRHEGDGE